MQLTENQMTDQINGFEGLEFASTTDIKDSLSKVLSDEINKETVSNLDKILSAIKIQKQFLQSERNRIFFPKQSSTDERLNEMGLNEENNALLFLSTQQTSLNIKNKLLNSIELNKIDFASTIFQKIVPQIPDTQEKWNEIKSKNNYKYNLLTSVRAIYNNFIESNGIKIIEREIEELNELESAAYEFRQNIKINHLQIN